MLSRLALRNAQIVPAMTHGVQFTSAVSPPRQPRPEFPSPVRHGFIPESWFTFFYPKTGVTGPYTFLATYGTYLFSKEIWVMEHEFYNGISLLVLLIYMTKKFGPSLSTYLDKEVDDYENSWEQSRKDEVAALKQENADMEKEQWRIEGQNIIMDIKKENVKMQLEAVYRERAALLYNEVKKRLDYQVQLQNIERRITQKHMVQWIINNVMKAITPDQEKATLQQCINDLERMSAKA